MTKILYVEDEPNLAKIVKESLESRDFSVRMIADGNDVLQAFHDFSPDICVLDVMLPNKDGFTLAKEIRQHNQQIPILFLSAKTQTEDVLSGFGVGGNDYIKKPFSLEELIVRINNLLRITKGDSIKKSAEAGIALGAYRFYPLKYQLHHGDQVRQLSHRESQLIQIFVEKQNTAIQRKDILLEIWGDDSFFNSRNLDVYIKKLRNYFKEDEQLKIITLKGVGYHFMVGG